MSLQHLYVLAKSLLYKKKPFHTDTGECRWTNFTMTLSQKQQQKINLINGARHFTYECSLCVVYGNSLILRLE